MRASTRKRGEARPSAAMTARGPSALVVPPGRGGGLLEPGQGLQAVRLEQPLELVRRLLRRLDELGLVVLNRVLRVDLALVVPLEQSHHALGRRGIESQREQRLPGHVQARRKGLAPDELDSEIAQTKQM